MTRKALLICGIVAPLLYVSTDMLAAALWDGYSYTAQTVSETFAIGAPTRPLVVARGLAYSALIIAFGLGIWVSASRVRAQGQRALRTAGKLTVGLGLVDLVGPFTPMHQRAVLGAGGATLTDTLHIILAGADVVLVLLIIGFGARAFAQRFRLYSICTLLGVVVSGAVTAMDGPRVAANLPTPWVGVTERICIFAFMLWFAMLATGLLRAAKRDGD